MRVAFVYPNPRGDLPVRVAAGDAPDTNLLGQNHLGALGIDAFAYDSLLRRRTPRSTALHRITWHGRELTLPWELRSADLIVTPLADLLPLVSRLRRRPRVLLVSYHLVSAWDRAGGARRRLQRASLGAAAGILTVSEAARTRLLERTGMPESHVRTATLGVDTVWWTSTPVPSDGFVLTVGRDLARDYKTFIGAMAGLQTRAVIVAKKENLRGIDVPENVEVRLNISPAEVRALYAQARCVVVPVHPETDPRGTENSGTIAMLEAMASGRPVVVSDRPYLRDYVSPETARVVPPADASAMREAVRSLLDDDVEATTLADTARRAAVERHSTRAFAARLAEAIGALPW